MLFVIMALVAQYEAFPSIGDRLLIQFANDDDPTLYQERLVAGIIDADARRFLVWSPDYEWDVNELNIGGDGGNITDIKFFPESRALPDGLTEDDVYLFFDESTSDFNWPKSKVLSALKFGHEESNRHRAAEGRPPLAPPSWTKWEEAIVPARRHVRKAPPSHPKPAPAGDGAAEVTTPRGQKDLDGAIWRCMYTRDSVKAGDEVPEPEHPVDQFGVSTVSNKDGSRTHVFSVKSSFNHDDFVANYVLTDKAGDDSKGMKVSDDARTLPVRSGVDGRHRDWFECTGMFEEEDFTDFPVQGPRTAKWCCSFLKRRHTPLDHHLMFKQAGRLQSEQWGVQQHEMIMRWITVAAEYDQLDLTNVAWAEMALRQPQTIEWIYMDRVREADAGTGNGKGQVGFSPEELSAFSGSAWYALCCLTTSRLSPRKMQLS